MGVSHNAVRDRKSNKLRYTVPHPNSPWMGMRERSGGCRTPGSFGAENKLSCAMETDHTVNLPTSPFWKFTLKASLKHGQTLFLSLMPFRLSRIVYNS